MDRFRRLRTRQISPVAAKAGLDGDLRWHPDEGDAFEAIHSSATALQKVGAIDKITMKGFDEFCLAARPVLKPAQTKKLRPRCRVSQPAALSDRLRLRNDKKAYPSG